MELLSKLVPVAMLCFVVSSMLAVGLSLTVAQMLNSGVLYELLLGTKI